MLITMRELGRRLHIGPSLIQRLRRRGKIPATRIGERYKITERAVCAKLKDMTSMPEVFLQPTEFPQDWLTPARAAAYLGVSKDTFYEYAHNKAFPIYRIGPKTYRVRQSEMERAFQV